MIHEAEVIFGYIDVGDFMSVTIFERVKELRQGWTSAQIFKIFINYGIN